MLLPDWEKVPSPRPRPPSFSDLFRESCVNQHLYNNKANLLTRLETRCNKILGTRPRMTGARDAGLVPPANLLTGLEIRCHKILGTGPRMTGAGGVGLVFVATHLPLTRSDAPTSPARGEAVGLLLNALLPKVSIFLPNPAKTY